MTVLRRDATRPGRAPGPARLAFLDPPYRSGLWLPALEALAAEGWLEAGALVLIELAKREPSQLPAGFSPLDERLYGPTRVLFATFGA